mgnify:CR=1 FL=1
MLGFSSIAATPIAEDSLTTYVVISASLVGTTSVGSVSLVTDQVLSQSGLSAACINGVVAINTGAGSVINAGASVGTTALGSVAVRRYGYRKLHRTDYWFGGHNIFRYSNAAYNRECFCLRSRD